MTLLGEPEKTNGLLGIVLAKESGQIEIQYVKKKWALPQPEESDKLYSVLLQSFQKLAKFVVYFLQNCVVYFLLQLKILM